MRGARHPWPLLRLPASCYRCPWGGGGRSLRALMAWLVREASGKACLPCVSFVHLRRCVFEQCTRSETKVGIKVTGFWCFISRAAVKNNRREFWSGAQEKLKTA